MSILKLAAIAALPALAFIAAPATAQAAPSTATQSCSTLKSLAKQRGFITRRYRQRDTRFVRGFGQCTGRQQLSWAIVRASDTSRCYLKICERRIIDRR